jgi:hypothetical protein
MMMMMMMMMMIHSEHWYERAPKLLQTSREWKVMMLWNQVQTDRTIPNNEP